MLIYERRVFDSLQLPGLHIQRGPCPTGGIGINAHVEFCGCVPWSTNVPFIPYREPLEKTSAC